jgi:hypothetical protein
MAYSKMYLFEEEIEQSLLEELVSDQSSFSEESDWVGPMIWL